MTPETNYGSQAQLLNATPAHCKTRYIQIIDENNSPFSPIKLLYDITVKIEANGYP